MTKHSNDSFNFNEWKFSGRRKNVYWTGTRENLFWITINKVENERFEEKEILFENFSLESNKASAVHRRWGKSLKLNQGFFCKLSPLKFQLTRNYSTRRILQNIPEHETNTAANARFLHFYLKDFLFARFPHRTSCFHIKYPFKLMFNKTILKFIHSPK